MYISYCQMINPYPNERFINKPEKNKGNLRYIHLKKPKPKQKKKKKNTETMN